MEKAERSLHPFTPSGYVLAPIHGVDDRTPLRICLLVHSDPDPVSGPFVLLRELPGSRVYLGAVGDAEAKIQEWVEVWVQTLELRELAFSGYQERLSNHAFDQRWRSECAMFRENLPHCVIATGMEEKNPSPILIKQRGGKTDTDFACTETTNWRICKDDAQLESFGLPAYTTSPFRYLHEPEATGTKTFLATAAHVRANS